MNWFASFFHGLARAFTLPASVRATIKSNPLTNLAAQVLISEGTAALSAVVDKNVSSPDLNAAVKQALADALVHSGVITN